MSRYATCCSCGEEMETADIGFHYCMKDETFVDKVMKVFGGRSK